MLAGKVTDGPHEGIKVSLNFSHVLWITMWDFRISFKYDVLLIRTTFWIILSRTVGLVMNMKST